MPDPVAAAITKLNLNGINLVPESQRVVPVGRLAEPVVGTVGWDGNGTSGMEYQLQSLLAGKSGTTDILRSPDGVALPSGNRSTPAQPGTGVELTLDESVQYVAEQALAAEIVASHATGGTAVVMDVKTGDILAMANLTSDEGAGRRPSAATPAATGSATLAAKVASTPDTSGATLVARSDTLPAGVVEAPVQLGGHPGLRARFRVQARDLLGRPGRRRDHAQHGTLSVPAALPMGKYTFHDAEQHGTESLTATQILAQSSNIGTIEVAQGLGETRLLDQISHLGFGKPTGLGIPGESQGLVPGASPVDRDLDRIDADRPGRRRHRPAGARRLQRRGRRRRLRVAPARPGHGGRDGTVTGTAASAGAPGHRPDHERRAHEHARVGGGQRDRHQRRRSTATPWPARPGTAQIPSPDHLGYIPGAYIGSFAGFAPAQHPVLSAIVVLDHPTPIYGGAVAAPGVLHDHGLRPPPLRHPHHRRGHDGRIDDGRGRHGQCHRARRSGHGRALGGPGSARAPLPPRR